jgi:hypothetical protein
MVQSGDFIATQPASAEETKRRWVIGVQMIIDQAREQQA